MFFKIRKPNSSDIIMVIGMFEYIINTIIHSSVLNWSERENVITTVIKYHCNTEDLSLYMIMIFLNIHLLMIAPVYETCIVITICTDYSLCDHWNVAWMKEKL